MPHLDFRTMFGNSYFLRIDNVVRWMNDVSLITNDYVERYLYVQEDV